MAHSPSNVTLTRHDTGITFDFLLPEDPRELARRRAWRLFEIGLFTLVATVIAYVVLHMLEWRVEMTFLAILLLVGITFLATAGSHSWKAWLDDESGDAIRQLSFAGDMLICTSRDHRKRIWYRDEISAIAISSETLATDAYKRPHSVASVQLAVTLKDGASVALGSPWPRQQRADLELILNELQKAMSKHPPPVNTSHAIQDLSAQPFDTHISEDKSSAAG